MPYPGACIGQHIDAIPAANSSASSWVVPIVHVLEVLVDDVHPVLPWPPRLSLITVLLPLCSPTSCSGVLHSQDVSQPSRLLSLIIRSSFRKRAGRSRPKPRGALCFDTGASRQRHENRGTEGAKGEGVWIAFPDFFTFPFLEVAHFDAF